MALAALAVLGGGLAAAHTPAPSVSTRRSPPFRSAPAGVLLGSNGPTRRLEHDRSLGRIGGRGLATAARILGGFALLLAITGALALGVLAVLTLASQ